MTLKGQPFKKIGAVLKQIAPTVATGLLVGGVGGGAVPIIANVAKQVFGNDVEESTLGKVLEAATQTPEGLQKIKELELAAKKLEADTGISFEALAVKDRDSARGLAKVKGIWPQVILSVVYSIGYFLVLRLFITGMASIEPGQEAMVASLVGVLTAGQVQILNFWLGSSAGSKDKTAVLANGHAT